jgi:hypothetical protein
VQRTTVQRSAGPRPAERRSEPDAAVNLPVRLLGVLGAVLATDPPGWADRPRLQLVLPLALAMGAWFAATPVSARPVATGYRWFQRLARHRNTAFAAICVLVAALNPPPTWLAACEVALLLSYLVLLDSIVAGPPAARLLRSPWTLSAAYCAAAVVLAAAVLPVAPSGAWARLAAAVALVAAAAAVTAALITRRR